MILIFSNIFMHNCYLCFLTYVYIIVILYELQENKADLNSIKEMNNKLNSIITNIGYNNGG